MQLKNINQISGQIELATGLHIGAGSEEIHIGGIDNAVIKHPYTNQPYIPGSSLKGKMRSLLEWKAGLVGESEGKPVSIELIETLSGDKKDQATAIVQLFGASGDSKNSELAEEIGPTRLSFWDCSLNKEWAEKVDKYNWLYTEAKSENTINRISGTADNPRQTERVPAGAIFDFKLAFKVLDETEEELLKMILTGLKLLEMDGIGGSGSRGYGKISWQNLRLNNDDWQAEYQAIEPFK
jgi:CRISPR-associated protein Csm3